MERNFNNEFERFLKENADQYRLYPSSKVWNGIYSALHTRRKWFGLGIILLLVTGTLVTILITHSSKETIVTVNKPVLNKQQDRVSALQVSSPDKRVSYSNNSAENNHNPVDFVSLKNNNRQLGVYDPVINNLTSIKENSFPNTNEDELERLTTNTSIANELTNQYIINNPKQKTLDYPRDLNTLNTLDPVTRKYSE